MKKTLLVALMGLMTIATANAAVDFENITITLMNNTVVKYNASQLSDVTYVGGQFGEEGAVGIKLYPTGSTSSVDFLYSQILSIVYNEQTTTTFTRITSTDQLEAGKRYIIVCEDASGAMGGACNTNYRALVAEGITLYNGTAIVENESEVSIFTLGGSTGSWTFNDGSYLANTSYSYLNSSTTASDNAKWTIGISNNNATITNKQNTSKTIYYQSNYSDFNASSSNTYSKMVQLYVEGDGGSSTTTVAMPTFSPAGGTFTSAQTVTISTTTSGATIYYTINGSTPTANSTVYTGSITVSTTTTIKAIAIKDGVSSSVATATFTISSSGTTDNNVNANWNISGKSIPQSKADPSFTNESTDDYSWRLEYPHINTASGNQRVVKATSAYGITYSLEWDNNIVANRWSCYTMCSKNNASNVDRSDDFRSDPVVTNSTGTSGSNSSSSYNESSIYSRGHLCPSADRLASTEQNKQTFFMTNMQPQYQSHNGGLWGTLEKYVREKWQPTNNTDTLYVVKAATISNVTLNNSTSTGIITTTTDKSGFTIPVPKYFYMAFLYYTKSDNSYKAFALWTEQKTSNNDSADSVITNRISIDELEARTGIDFFCNLPDDIEATVEAAATYWDNSQ